MRPSWFVASLATALPVALGSYRAHTLPERCSLAPPSS
jgi:hypothetical protein